MLQIPSKAHHYHRFAGHTRGITATEKKMIMVFTRCCLNKWGSTFATTKKNILFGNVTVTLLINVFVFKEALKLWLEIIFVSAKKIYEILACSLKLKYLQN